MTAALHPDIQNTPCVFFPAEKSVMMWGSGIILIAGALAQIPSVAKKLSPGKVNALTVASAFVVIANGLKPLVGHRVIQLLGVEAQLNNDAIGMNKSLRRLYSKFKDKYSSKISYVIEESTADSSQKFKPPTINSGKQTYMFTRGRAFLRERGLQRSQLKGGAHSISYGRRLQAGRFAAPAPRGALHP